jgi:hypothetical protein
VRFSMTDQFRSLGLRPAIAGRSKIGDVQLSDIGWVGGVIPFVEWVVWRINSVLPNSDAVISSRCLVERDVFCCHGPGSPSVRGT